MAGFTTGTESRKHLKAKLKARQILEYLGCRIVTEEQKQQGISFGQSKTWSIDAYGELLIKIGIEIDGRVGHGTKITIPKDKQRDKENLQKNQLYTIRFTPDDILKLPIQDIMLELRHQMKKQGLVLLQNATNITI